MELVNVDLNADFPGEAELRELADRKRRLQRRLSSLRSQYGSGIAESIPDLYSHATESMIYDGACLMDGAYFNASRSVFGRDSANPHQREIDDVIAEIEECERQERDHIEDSEGYAVVGFSVGVFYIELSRWAIAFGIAVGGELGYPIYGSAGVCWELEIGREGIFSGKYTFAEAGIATAVPGTAYWAYVYAAAGAAREF
jgi:hypothetical protein